MPAWSSSRVASLYGVKVDWQTKFLDLQTEFVEKDKACTKALNKMQETANKMQETVQQNFEALKNESMKVQEESKKVQTLLEEKNKRLEEHLFIAEIKTSRVVHMRVLVELAAKFLYPQAKSATAATEQVVQALKINGNLSARQLNANGTAYLEALLALDTMKAEPRNVCVHLQSLYSSLSTECHYLPSGPEGTYITGDLLPRLCVGMCVLDAQTKGFPVGPIHYADSNDRVVAELRGGKVLKKSVEESKQKQPASAKVLILYNLINTATRAQNEGVCGRSSR